MKYAALVLVAAAAVLIGAAVWNYVDKYEGVAPQQTPVPTLTAWTEADGTPVSRDVLEVFRGPEHCNWESSLMLFTGDPLGSNMNRREQFQPDLGLYRLQYLRDPQGVYPAEMLLSTYGPDVELPSTAAATGYSWEGKEMWVDAADPEAAAYIVYDDHVERWPRAREAILCA